jgi:hypothetical protein
LRECDEVNYPVELSRCPEVELMPIQRGES